jgi:hypothetical protein
MIVDESVVDRGMCRPFSKGRRILRFGVCVSAAMAANEALPLLGPIETPVPADRSDEIGAALEHSSNSGRDPGHHPSSS